MPGTPFSPTLTIATVASAHFFLNPPRLLPCQGEVARRVEDPDSYRGRRVSSHCEERSDDAISPLRIRSRPRRQSEHSEESEKLNPTSATALRSPYSTSPTFDEVAEPCEAGGVSPH